MSSIPETIEEGLSGRRHSGDAQSVLGSLAEVEAVPALVTDTDDSFTSLHSEEAQDDAARNNEIVVQTSQFYGIDLVTLDENKTLL